MRIQAEETIIQQTQSPSARSRVAYVALATAFLLFACTSTTQVYPQTAQAHITLSWGASDAPDLDGYFVYYYAIDYDSNQAREYKLNARNPTTPCGHTPPPCYTLIVGEHPGIIAGHTYVFAVTAYDKVGNESDHSPAKQGTVSQPDPVTPPTQ